MASQNPFLVDWVKGAYGMEMGLAPMIEEQTQRLDDDTELHKGLSQHLEKTRHHASLLRERLRQMGEDTSTIRPIDPVTVAIGHTNGGKPDMARQTELLDYVAETFEVASYRALQSLAEMLGDHETSRVCEQILADELAISDALGRRMPGHNGRTDTHAPAIQRELTLAREVFGALNAHDLDRFDQMAAPFFRAEMPGDSRPVDRKENRTRLERLFAAFPDLRFELNRVAASGESVFVEWTATGKQTGPLAMMDGGSLRPTNKNVRIAGVAILRFENGKLTHSKVVSDSGDLARQLGITPGAARAVAASTGAGRDITHLEIPAFDADVAAHFYGELFGWEYEHVDQPRYTVFRSGNVRGGFPDVSEMNPVGEVLFYVDSKDIVSDLRRAESLGGRIVVPRTEIPGRGYFAVLADPSGNHVGLFRVNRPA